MNTHVDLALCVVALAQFLIALLNLFLIRIMNWKPDLERAPLLIREVFHVHCIFISITLSIFASLTWRFAPDIATAANPLAIWLATAIGIFWLVRAIMQWTYYSGSHWRGQLDRTLVHWILFLGYAAFAAIYFTAAFWRDS